MPDTGNIPIQHLQQGSVLNVASAGTVVVAAGGSIQNAGALSVASGALITVLSGGTVSVAAGGSIQNAGGMSATNLGVTALSATNGTFGSINATDGTFAGTITIGGTAGRWAFGSIALTAGTAIVNTGLTQIIYADAVFLAPLGAGTGAGSATSFQVNPSRFANGSAIYLGLTGTSAFGGAGTIAWNAFGY